jgi:DNA-binding FadR family transcriptional regulator
LPIERITHIKAYAKIVSQIKELINRGEYKIGEKLPPERELSAQFGVARPTVREALSALEILGIIEIQVGSGAYVRWVPDRDISTSFAELQKESSPIELLEARIPIEGVIAAQAAIKAPIEAIENLNQLSMEMEKDFSDGDYQIEKDRLFHLKIAEATGNMHFVEILKYFNTQMAQKIWVKYSEKNREIPGRIERYIKNHRSILEAIEERDPERAQAMMEMHIKTGLKNFYDDWD